MFFIVSKIFAFLLSPLVWVFTLVTAGLLAKNDTGRKLILAGVCVLFICGNSFFVDECFRHWEPVTQDFDSHDTKYEAAIVLGGLGDIDQRLKKIKFGGEADRLFQTLPLYYSGRIRRLVFTGGSGSIEFPGKREGLYVKSYLQSIAFPDTALIIESSSRNTWENAVYTKHLLDSLRINGRMLLVTSAFHMPRAMAVFKKAGFKNLDPFITNKVSGVRRFTPDHLLIPNTRAMSGLEVLLHEILGFVVYKFKGYA